MSKPLAHLEMLLEGIQCDIVERKEKKVRLESSIAALEEYERKIRLCLRDEQNKTVPPYGDKHGPA